MRISYWSSDVCSSDLAAQRFVATARGGGNDFAVEQQAHFEAVAIAETMHAHVRGECALQRAGIGTLSVVAAAGTAAHGEQAFVFEDACRLLPGDDADAECLRDLGQGNRKSTRLKSSH